MIIRDEWEIWARALWYAMDDYQPEVSQEILFITRDGITEERIGMVLPESKIVFLKRSSISFEDILYWLPIPKDPREN